MTDCIFCKIANRELLADIVHEDEELLAFKDVQPQAPVHLLIIPKKHISSLTALKKEDRPLMGKAIALAKILAEKHGVENRGYRIVVNAGPDAGQAVAHIHFHLLAGRTLQWPPG